MDVLLLRMIIAFWANVMDRPLFISVIHYKYKRKKMNLKIICRDGSNTICSLKIQNLRAPPNHPATLYHIYMIHADYILYMYMNYCNSKVGTTCQCNVFSPFQSQTTDLHSVQWEKKKIRRKKKTTFTRAHKILFSISSYLKLHCSMRLLVTVDNNISTPSILRTLKMRSKVALTNQALCFLPFYKSICTDL